MGPKWTPKEVEAKVLETIATGLCPETPEFVILSASFKKDPGADSLDLIEIVMKLEELFELEIPDKEAEKMQIVSKAVDWIILNLKAKHRLDV